MAGLVWISQSPFWLLTVNMSGKRKILTLEERVKVLQRVDKGEKPALVDTSIGCGKTQIQNIIKDKVR